MDKSFKTLRAIFDEASEMNDVEARAAFVTEACGGDESLQQRVQALLKAHASAGGFLRSDTDRREGPLAEGTSSILGRYKLVEKLGEGGCGVVYMAQQMEPVKRCVALKVIKLGMDTRSVIARFEAERQALALMDHPNIATVLDAGATEAGRPYFVMELVRGVRITDYCDQNNLPTRERLDLFIQVCHAIQHAHQKGIIHRDIKPSNILVTSHDGEAVPKIIDFGIAKATSGVELTDKTFFTQYELLIGTPAYMSPEQVQTGGLDIDTRSDIYSLGVLLYELLTGRPPFDADTLLKSGLDAMRCTIRDTEPLRPSTRLRTLVAADLTAVAKRRQAEPLKLVSLVRGDLDWIVLKALEKDRARRYETANGLAADIQRHMHDEPVGARPPTGLDLFQKLVRRNKVLFAAGGAVGLALVIGLGISTVLFVKERQARREADAAWLSEQQQHRQAEAKTEESRQRLVRLNVSTGNRLVEEGELHGALNWFVAALALEQGDPARERIHRQRIGAVLRQAPELSQLWFHEAFITSAAFSSDGTRVASGSLDRTARVWDVNTGRPVTPPLLHKREVEEVRFTPDGRRLITLAQDHRLRVWDVATGQVLAELDTDTEARRYDVSRDGRHVVAPVLGGTRIFNLETGEPSGFFLHKSRVNVACFNQDATGVFSASRGGNMVEWMSDAPNTSKLWMPHPTAVSSIVLSPDGRTLATVAQPQVRLWDTTTREMLAELPDQPGFLYQPVFSPDGRWLATVGFDASARVWNVTNGQPISPILPHDAGVWEANFSPDSRWLATASWDRTARVWDAQTGKPALPILRHGGFVLAAEFSPDGRHLLTAGQDATARLWWFQTNSAARLVFHHEGEVWLAAYDRTGERILTGGNDGTAHVWDARTGRLLTTLSHRESVYDGGFCGDGNRVVISCRTTAHVWDLKLGREIGTPATHSNHINFIDINADGSAFITASRDGTARVWSTENIRPITPPLTNSAEVRYARFSPDGQRVITAGGGQARLWDARTGQRLGPDLPHEGVVQRGRFSPDGRRVITATTDDTMLPRYAQVWDAESGQPIGPRLEHLDGVRDAVFSPDGRRLASGGEDFAAIVWDAVTGERITPALRHERMVVYTVFSPDSRLLLTVSWDGTARVWDAATGDPVTPPLKHEGMVRIGRWSPDGREVLTGAADGTVRVWDVSPSTAPLEELQRQAELLSAHRLKPDIGAVPLSAAELQERWQALRGRP